MNTSLILFEEFLENLNETATANAKERPIAGLNVQCFFSLHCHDQDTWRALKRAKNQMLKGG